MGKHFLCLVWFPSGIFLVLVMLTPTGISFNLGNGFIFTVEKKETNFIGED